MKNVRLFETKSEYESAELICPNLSYTKDDGNTYSHPVKFITLVDLGLPSGTKWMKCNIGAETETDFGLFFQWGDTVGYAGDDAKKYSYWSTSPGNGGSSSYDLESLESWNKINLTNGLLSPKTDAAFVHTNGQAKMPTREQFLELISGTNHSWTTNNGVIGRTFTNKSDSSKYIFIPAAGYYIDGKYASRGQGGYAWTSSLGDTTANYAFNFRSYSSGSSATVGGSSRYFGLNIRGVHK